MSDVFDERLVPSSDAISSAVGDETVILQLAKGTYFGLDPLGTKIWGMLKEGKGPAAIYAQLTEEYDVAPDVLKTDVRYLLEELKRNEIVTAVEKIER